MKERAVVLIKGRVQGVFFREYSKKKAEQIGINGYVKNLPNGDVLLEAEGDSKSIDELIAWCHMGPPGASVVSVDVSKNSDLKNFNAFLINY